MNLASLQSLIESLMFIIQFFCWLDEVLGLNIIPDEICTYGQDEA